VTTSAEVTTTASATWHGSAPHTTERRHSARPAPHAARHDGQSSRTRGSYDDATRGSGSTTQGNPSSRVADPDRSVLWIAVRATLAVSGSVEGVVLGVAPSDRIRRRAGVMRRRPRLFWTLKRKATMSTPSESTFDLDVNVYAAFPGEKGNG